MVKVNVYQRLPISEIKDYSKVFYVFSTLKAGWAASLVQRRHETSSPFGLEDRLLPHEDVNVSWYPTLSYHDDDVIHDFGFDPKSYLQFDGWHRRSEDLATKTQDAIQKLRALSAREGAKTVIVEDMNAEVAYCSDNMLEQAAKTN